MESLASESSIKLVVKTPNQTIKDIEVSCLLDWTVEKLKSHLSLVYPTKPARSSQKIIYSGKLLHDHIILKDVLQEGEGSHQTVHLVCTPSSSDLKTSKTTTSATNMPTSSSPQVTSTPSTTTTTQGSTEPDGIRHRRNHPFAQHPFHNLHNFGHPPHFPQANVEANVAGHYMFPQGYHVFPQGHQMFPPSHPHMYPNAQYFGAHSLHYAAQHMAHMHWMQQMAMQRNMHRLPVVHPNIPPQHENIPAPVQQVNQPVDAAPPAAQVPPAQERRENPAQNRNMVMNANAGGGMMQGEDEEENGQRDWLDYVYMAVRISMLMSIFWFYSSAERLIIMGLVVFIVWLVQSGVLNLNRAPINRQQEVQINQGNNNAAERQEQGEEQGTEEGEVIEQDSESEFSESQTEDETDNTNNNNETHPGYFFVWYNFFVTFFTSLVPQAPGAIAQP